MYAYMHVYVHICVYMNLFISEEQIEAYVTHIYNWLYLIQIS